MIVAGPRVLIGSLDASDAHHRRAAALLTREVDEDLAANLLTLREVAQPEPGDATRSSGSSTTCRSRPGRYRQGRLWRWPRSAQRIRRGGSQSASRLRLAPVLDFGCDSRSAIPGQRAAREVW